MDQDAYADTGFCHFWNFALASALSGATGMRASLPLFLLSLCHKLHPHDYPLSHETQWLAKDEVVMLLGALFLVEVLADQIPAVDHALHAVLTPAHGGMGGVAAIAPAYCGGLATKVPMAIMGASMALTVHAGKSTLRAASSGASCGMCNPVISMCESIGIGIVLALCMAMPFVALITMGFFIYMACMGVKKLMTQTSDTATSVPAPSAPPRESNEQQHELLSQVEQGATGRAPLE
eukprot:gnl/MRDRNA2_/MRDRNA2_167384_c0_seq1.p1 gnl/MRDRNA2_/MRDRNA2_167384_c0~~gnl/MRDRNA2_/MRDRNA2_167384_c0_seq1.p1  ORF type:complete len:254 (+),score=42.02 gnl/MRDRNA2_/MRDRNA2_167384_c0_seq1:55-762(+)